MSIVDLQPHLLTVEEAARTLRLAPSSVYRRVEAGELRAARLGAGPKAPMRIPQQELERYLGLAGSAHAAADGRR
jgi:excisionase family DNA binding protein